ncbi:MAG TPA: hypothetical protein VLB82_12535 [Thermodesulfobacteriota bacterium]|nr:hypothetical protein [Thermodesulfobacteriota bacterium]
MAEVTIQIPDPIFENIKRRAEQVGNTPEGIIAVNTILIYGPAYYKSEKWLKNSATPENNTQPWD